MKKLCILLILMFFISSQGVFADEEALKIKVNINLNDNESIDKDSISVNYISEYGYNIVFSKFTEPEQEVLIPIGKYKLDFIDFPMADDLGLEVKAPKEFEVSDDELELNFDVTKISKNNSIKDEVKSVKEKSKNKKVKKDFKFDYSSLIILIGLFIALYFVRNKSRINTKN